MVGLDAAAGVRRYLAERKVGVEFGGRHMEFEVAPVQMMGGAVLYGVLILSVALYFAS